jgi:hypothetical protein
MLIISDALVALNKAISPYFLNMLLLLANVLVGFHTQFYSIMFSSLAAILVCTYLYDANHAAINIQLMDNIIIIAILFPIGFLWFQKDHPLRVYSGLIMLWAFGLYILNKLIGINSVVSFLTDDAAKMVPIITGPTSVAKVILNYLASYGHFIFNLEWALLVLL